MIYVDFGFIYPFHSKKRYIQQVILTWIVQNTKATTDWVQSESERKIVGTHWICYSKWNLGKNMIKHFLIVLRISILKVLHAPWHFSSRPIVLYSIFYYGTYRTYGLINVRLSLVICKSRAGCNSVQIISCIYI